MSLQTISEHTFDTSLLRENAIIIDIGCRGFELTNYFRNLGDIVHAVDIDDFPGQDYDRVAITGTNGFIAIKRTNDPQATSVKEGDEIISMTLETYMQFKSIEFADLIKMDIEGSEHDVIMSLQRAPAKQLSIEFHLHTGVYGMAEVALMVAKLNVLGYKTVQHELTARHGLVPNFWDSLFILE